jgi:hypothetical protein
MTRRSATFFLLLALAAAITWQSVAADGAAAVLLKADDASPTIAAAATIKYRLQGARKHLLQAAPPLFGINAEGAHAPDSSALERYYIIIITSHHSHNTRVISAMILLHCQQQLRYNQHLSS